MTDFSAPESFSIAQQSIGPVERYNLAAIANLITHVAAQELSNIVKDWFVRTPLMEYIRSDGVHLCDFILDGEQLDYIPCNADLEAVASVDPLEAHFQAHELFESTLEATPISITRSEIYGMLSILIKRVPVLVSDVLDSRLLLSLPCKTAKKPRDPIAAVLAELEGPPIDFDRSKATFSLRLTNRLAELQGKYDSIIRIGLD